MPRIHTQSKRPHAFQKSGYLAALTLLFPAFAHGTSILHASLLPASATTQTAAAGQAVPEPFAVKIVDEADRPVAGVTVWFDVDYCVDMASSGSVAAPCPTAAAYGDFAGPTGATVVSDRTGRAVAPRFVAGDVAAQYSVSALVPEQNVGDRRIVQRGNSVHFQLSQIGQSGGLPRTPAGMYYAVGRDGEGWQLTLGTANGGTTVVATWYTYDHGQQIWLLGVGTYAGLRSPVSLAISQTSGASFGSAFNPADVVQTPWGTATLHWTDCDHLRADYQRKDGVSGSLDLVRFFHADNDTLCE
jgi:hypothetical protein